MSKDAEREKSCCAPNIQTIEKNVPCCAPPPGQRILNFPDGTQCGLNGLDDILANIYSEGRGATDQTAEEIINRLEAKKNYIPSSDKVREDYSYVLLREYTNYIKTQNNKRRWHVKLTINT
jgi:hypothetical protein